MKDNKVSKFRGSTRRRQTKEHHKQRVETERALFERTHKSNGEHPVLSFWIKDDKAELDYFIVEFRLKDTISLKEFRERLEKELGDLIEENTIN